MTTFIWDFDTAKKADIIDPLLGYSRSEIWKDTLYINIVMSQKNFSK